MDLFVSTITELLDKIYCPKKHLILSGDFNVDFANKNHLTFSILQLFSSYGLASHVNGVTRAGSASGTQIDNIFSTLREEDLNCEIHLTDISDHYGQILTFRTSNASSKVSYNRKRFFTDANIMQFINHLEAETWQDVYQANDVNEKYITYMNIFHYYFNLSFPLSSSRIKRHGVSWVTTEIRDYAQYIKDLYVLYKQTNSQEIYKHYRGERAAYRKFLSEYRTSVNENLICNSKNKVKTAWNIFNKETNKKGTHSDITLKFNNKKIENPTLLLNY